MEQTLLPLGDRVIIADARDEVRNPYDGSLVASVPSCTAGHVDEACRVALEALRRGLPQAQRAEILERASSLLRGRVAEFASTVALESGKPIRTARVEALRCADTLAFSAAEARLLAGAVVPLDASAAGAGRIGFTIAEPLGVVAAITPFNFPLNLVAHKVAPAIAAGCPVVLKPAELTPLSAIRLIALLLEAGLPRDWITVVTGPGQTVGRALVAHPVPAMVTFTGSTAVGWSIAASAPKKKVSLELGSTAPVIIEPSTDLGLIASKIAIAGYSHAGQSCVATQGVLVHRSVCEEFTELLDKEVAGLTVGDPLDANTDVGPLITQREAHRVESWISEARERGGVIGKGRRAKRRRCRADGRSGATKGLPPLARRDLRPGCRGGELRRLRRGARVGERHSPGAPGRGLDLECGQGARGYPRARFRGRVHQRSADVSC